MHRFCFCFFFSLVLCDSWYFISISKVTHPVCVLKLRLLTYNESLCLQNFNKHVTFWLPCHKTYFLVKVFIITRSIGPWKQVIMPTQYRSWMIWWLKGHCGLVLLLHRHPSYKNPPFWILREWWYLVWCHESGTCSDTTLCLPFPTGSSIWLTVQHAMCWSVLGRQWALYIFIAESTSIL